MKKKAFLRVETATIKKSQICETCEKELNIAEDSRHIHTENVTQLNSRREACQEKQRIILYQQKHICERHERH